MLSQHVLLERGLTVDPFCICLCMLCRGIDFKGVRTVVNVHPPPTVASYVHRVGRTGRAGLAGAALTLTSPRDDELVAQLEEALQGGLSFYLTV